jgi:uncharacterized membrane protein HdeD (DUF308 family)
VDPLKIAWQLLLIRGVAGIIFGIVAMIWPIHTAIALAILWGVWALFDGVGWLIQAFGPMRTSGRVWSIIMGIIALLAAFFAIFSPAMAAVTLTWILGIWLIVRGGFEFFAAFGAEGWTRWLVLLGGVVSVVLGVLFVANPGRSAVAVTFTLGLFALIWGIVQVLAAWAGRRTPAQLAT